MRGSIVNTGWLLHSVPWGILHHLPLYRTISICWQVLIQNPGLIHSSVILIQLLEIISFSVLQHSSYPKAPRSNLFHNVLLYHMSAVNLHFLVSLPSLIRYAVHLESPHWWSHHLDCLLRSWTLTKPHCLLMTRSRSYSRNVKLRNLIMWYDSCKNWPHTLNNVKLPLYLHLLRFVLWPAAAPSYVLWKQNGNVSQHFLKDSGLLIMKTFIEWKPSVYFLWFKH